MADLEHGTWPGNSSLNINNNPINADLITAMLKGESNHMAIKGGDAQSGALQSLYNGPRPAGYSPMKKQGAHCLQYTAVLFCSNLKVDTLVYLSELLV